MQLTIRYKTRYLDFEVITTTRSWIQHIETYVTACYFISESQGESDVNIWEILPNEIQVEIEKQIN